MKNFQITRRICFEEKNYNNNNPLGAINICFHILNDYLKIYVEFRKHLLQEYMTLKVYINKNCKQKCSKDIKG